MAEITRQTPDVNPTNYIRPGVQDNSTAVLVEGLGEAGLELDKQLALEKLGNQADALRTKYLVGSPAAIALQEANQDPDVPPLTAGDKKEIDSVTRELAKGEAARDQGRMTYESYRVRGERMLRMAIARRPGLATELRQQAAAFLGTDVVGAAVDVLAGAERAMAKGEDGKGGPDMKRVRDDLDAVGIANAGWDDTQALAMWTQQEDVIRARREQEYRKDSGEAAVALQESGIKLRGPAAQQQFIAASQDVKLDVFSQIQKGMQGWGGATPEQRTQIAAGGQAMIQQKISQLLAIAGTDVPDDIRDAEIASLQALGKTLNDLATGALDQTTADNAVKAISLRTQYGMLTDNETIKNYNAITGIMGEGVMVKIMEQSPSMSKDVVLGVGSTLTGTGQPRTRAQYAGVGAAGVMATVLDRGSQTGASERMPAMTDYLNKAAVAFVQVPKNEYRAEWFTGSHGYLTAIHRQKNALAKTLSSDMTGDLAASIRLSAMAHYQAVASSFTKEAGGGLRDKVEIGLDAKSGNIITPKAGAKLAPAEVAVIDKYNRAMGGRMVIDTISTLTGATADQAKQYFYNGYTEYKKVQSMQQRAPTPAQPKPAATQSGGGGNWWETF